MQTVTIKPTKEIRISTEAENISPDKFAGKTEHRDPIPGSMDRKPEDDYRGAFLS